MCDRSLCLHCSLRLHGPGGTAGGTRHEGNLPAEFPYANPAAFVSIFYKGFTGIASHPAHGCLRQLQHGSTSGAQSRPL
jgi:hypothetical protein